MKSKRSFSLQVVAALYAVLRCTLPRKTLSSVAARRMWKGKQLQRQVHQAMWRTILLPLLKGPTHLELRNYVFLSWELLWRSDSFSCFKVSNTGRRDSKSLLGFDCVHNWAFCSFSDLSDLSAFPIHVLLLQFLGFWGSQPLTILSWLLVCIAFRQPVEEVGTFPRSFHNFHHITYSHDRYSLDFPLWSWL